MSDNPAPVSDLLAARRVDEATPEFWARLEAELAAEPSPLPRLDIEPTSGHTRVPVDPSSINSDVVELRRRRGRRLILAAAGAAALVAIVIALNVNRQTESTTITDPTPTVTSPSHDDDALSLSEVDIGNDRPEFSLLASNDRLLAASSWNSGGACSIVAEALPLVGAVSTDAAVWTPALIESPPAVSEVLDLGACLSIRATVLAGAGRFVVATKIEASFDPTSYARRVLADLRPDLETGWPPPVATDESTIPDEFQFGTELVERPYSVEEYEDARNRFEDVASDSLGPDATLSLVWESTDGLSWTSVEPSGPLTVDGSLQGAVATAGGFYAANLLAGTIEFSADLVNWQVLERGVEALPDFTVWGDDVVWLQQRRVVGTDRVVLPESPEDAGARARDWVGGEFGLIGMKDQQPADITIVDSLGSTQWPIPTELVEPQFTSPSIGGVGDDFAVLVAHHAPSDNPNPERLFVLERG